jgi:competence protein ComEC
LPTDLSVTFLDVGQADAALIRTPEDETILFDAGHDATAAGLLRRQRIRRIDLLVLSHSHDDHAGGLTALAKGFKINEIWYSGVDWAPRRRQRLASAARLQMVRAGYQRQFHKLVLTVLHPEPVLATSRPGGDPVNNNSLVVKLDYGPSQFLFPGDCELECWDELFRLHRPQLRADVLKAAHHGSSNGTSSGVLANVRPATLIISCGRRNDYHHPHPIVLTLARKLGAQIPRTDEHGSIHCLATQCAPAN